MCSQSNERKLLEALTRAESQTVLSFVVARFVDGDQRCAVQQQPASKGTGDEQGQERAQKRVRFFVLFLEWDRNALYSACSPDKVALRVKHKK